MPSSPPWQVAFTESFQHGLQRLGPGVTDLLLDKIAPLVHDPHRPLPNVRALRGKKDRHSRYRLRIGDLRVIYALDNRERRIVLTAVGHRKDIYRKDRSHASPIAGTFPLTPSEEVLPLDPIASSTREPAAQPTPPPQPIRRSARPSAAGHGGVRVETLEELDPLELIYLGIPENFHDRLRQVRELDDLETIDLPDTVRDRLVDYLTNPAATQVERLYSVREGEPLEQLARRPLSHFLLLLDPQQRRIVERSAGSGPLLVRGGPGTGKSLVGIYRLVSLIDERRTESLFDEEPPFFRFITYTKTLTRTAEALFQMLVRRDPATFRVKFSHYDAMVADGIHWLDPDAPHDIIAGRDLHAFLRDHVLAPLRAGSNDEQQVARLIEQKLGIDFLAEEITDLIEANGITTKRHYLDFERRGRGTALRRQAREAIWLAYDRFREACARKWVLTWAGRRLLFHDLCRQHRDRFPLADYIVVDEAQDLSVVALRTLPLLVKDPTGIMLLADSGQSIYNRAPSWKYISSDLRFHRGNSILLVRSYRMTRQLARALQPLRNDADIDPDDPIASAQGVFTGPRPAWIRAPRATHYRVATGIVQRLVHGEGIRPGQVAIILRSVRREDELQQEIIRPLSRHGIGSYIFSKEKPIDLGGDAVHIITAHSAKGLEFPFVVVPFVVDGVYPWRRTSACSQPADSEDEWLAEEERVLYVALSRASHRLWMLTDPAAPSPFLDVLDESAWEVRELRP